MKRLIQNGAISPRVEAIFYFIISFNSFGIINWGTIMLFYPSVFLFEVFWKRYLREEMKNWLEDTEL